MKTWLLYVFLPTAVFSLPTFLHSAIQLTYDDAIKYCKRQGQGRYFLPDDLTNSTNLVKYMNLQRINSVWVALRKETLKDWKWTNGAPGTKPSGIEQPERVCAGVSTVDQTIRAMRCNYGGDHEGFICEKQDTTSCHGPSPGEYCFSFLNSTFTFQCGINDWYTAEVRCRRKGRVLAVVDSADKVKAFVDEKNKHSALSMCSFYWVGQRKEDWKVVNAEGIIRKIIESHWAYEQPQHGMNCSIATHFEGNFKWTTRHCYQKEHAVCVAQPAETGPAVTVESKQPASMKIESTSTATGPSDQHLTLLLAVVLSSTLVLFGILIALGIFLRRKRRSNLQEEDTLLPHNNSSEPATSQETRLLDSTLKHGSGEHVEGNTADDSSPQNLIVNLKTSLPADPQFVTPEVKTVRPDEDKREQLNQNGSEQIDTSAKVNQSAGITEESLLKSHGSDTIKAVHEDLQVKQAHPGAVCRWEKGNTGHDSVDFPIDVSKTKTCMAVVSENIENKRDRQPLVSFARENKADQAVKEKMTNLPKEPINVKTRNQHMIDEQKTQSKLLPGNLVMPNNSDGNCKELAKVNRNAKTIVKLGFVVSHGQFAHIGHFLSGDKNATYAVTENMIQSQLPRFVRCILGSESDVDSSFFTKLIKFKNFVINDSPELERINTTLHAKPEETQHIIIYDFGKEREAYDVGKPEIMARLSEDSILIRNAYTLKRLENIRNIKAISVGTICESKEKSQVEATGGDHHFLVYTGYYQHRMPIKTLAEPEPREIATWYTATVAAMILQLASAKDLGRPRQKQLRSTQVMGEILCQMCSHPNTFTETEGYGILDPWPYLLDWSKLQTLLLEKTRE